MASSSQPHSEVPETPKPPKPVRHLSALEVDDESPSPSPVKPTAQRSALGVGLSSGISSHITTPIHKAQSRFSSYRPSMSSLRSGRIVSRRVSRAVEDGDEDGPKLPSLVPGIRAAYSTPLPMLPMVVLCIVSLKCARPTFHNECKSSATDPRLCFPSSFRQTCLSPSCLRWWRVS